MQLLIANRVVLFATLAGVFSLFPAGRASAESEVELARPTATPAKLSVGTGAATLPAPNAQSKKKPSYDQLLRNAADCFKKRQYDEAISRLDEASQLLPVNADVLNMRGAICAEQANFEQAAAFYNAALQKDPKAFWPKFNLAEISFLKKDYGTARIGFESVLQEYPRNAILDFKIFLTYLLQADDENAKAILENPSRLSQESAPYYFAQAAWEYAHKNPKLGLGWVQRAEVKFPDGETQFLHDSLADLDWIERTK